MGMIIINGEEYASAPKNGFPPIVYSDEEREIGVWRDGKPLYQKTFTLTNIPSSFNDYVECQTITNMDLAIKIEFVAKRSSGGNTLIYSGNSLSRGESNAGFMIAFRQRETKLYYFIIGYNGGITEVQTTVYYTKTTDTPGSGKYTTYGGLTHHYSTSEQVIGTWIDGKPLYEKTYELTNLSQDTDNHTIDATLTKSTVSMKHIKKGFYTLGGAYSGDGFSGDDIYTNDITQRLRVFCNSNGLGYSLQNSAYQITRFIITIQYTKTTD